MQTVQRTVHGISALFIMIVALTLPVAVNAATKSAHAVAEDVKNQLIDLVNNRASIEAQGEGKYYDAVVALFEPVVDFDFIARGVMSNHAKTATAEQQQRFAAVLKNSLMSTVTTYSQGLAGTSGFDINVLPPKPEEEGKNRVTVGLEVKTGDSVNRLAFTMQKKDMQIEDEPWKIANMTLNGINLGQTFRIQFDQAVKKAEGNIDAAIDGWSS